MSKKEGMRKRREQKEGRATNITKIVYRNFVKGQKKKKKEGRRKLEKSQKIQKGN